MKRRANVMFSCADIDVSPLANLRFLQRICNIHDATRRRLAHRAEAYSPECVEGKFCELRIAEFFGSTGI
jgi:hypothetical protein